VFPLLIQCASEQRLDYCLPANVELGGPLIQIAKHALSDTFTRRTGRTTVNSLLKYTEISSPRDAISAISSALGIFLDVFGIAFFFLLGGPPRGNEAIVLPLRIVSDFKDHRAEPAARITVILSRSSP
jgi:hypothetical protein